jgi:hypothetical protein
MCFAVCYPQAVFPPDHALAHSVTRWLSRTLTSSSVSRRRATLLIVDDDLTFCACWRAPWRVAATTRALSHGSLTPRPRLRPPRQRFVVRACVDHTHTHIFRPSYTPADAPGALEIACRCVFEEGECCATRLSHGVTLRSALGSHAHARPAIAYCVIDRDNVTEEMILMLGR